MTSDAYRALALQFRTASVNACPDGDSARELICSSIDRLRTQVEASVRFIGEDCKLVVLPEYTLTGHPVGEAPALWREKAVLDQDGAEIKALGAIAQDLGIHLAFNAYVSDEAFPQLYFQASMILDPTGSVILRYVRLNSIMTPTPHDVLDEYVERYGYESLFPVARTPLGVLACIASEEILFPEVARCLALNGAEVFLHSSSEVAQASMTRKQIARRARAFENVAYVISANSAGIDGSPIPSASTDGGSAIIDHEGRVLVEAAGGETMAANAEVDLAALRRARSRPGMDNLASRNRLELYARMFAERTVHEPNRLAGGAQPDRRLFMQAQLDAIERLKDLGG